MIKKKPPLRKILDLYDAFIRDGNMSRVAAILGVGKDTLRVYVEKYPEFAMAKELADARRDEQGTFSNYVFKRLSAEARAVWEEIKFWDGKKSAYEKINEILAGHPKKLKQELFVHALVASNFDLSSACRTVCLQRVTLEKWKNDDMGFRQLIEEIQWHKKNFFERALLDLVHDRNPTAVVFANRTINADRGYNEKLEVSHSGEVKTGGGLSLEQLEPYLDLDTKKKLLLAIRQVAIEQKNAPLQLANAQIVESDK